MGGHTWLHQAAFDGDWFRFAYSLLEIPDDGEAPLVLLPDDIQFDDYAPYFDTKFGREAVEWIESVDRLKRPPRIVLCDLSPYVTEDWNPIGPHVEHVARAGGIEGSLLVIYTPTIDLFDLEVFDCVSRETDRSLSPPSCQEMISGQGLTLPDFGI